MYFFDTYAIIEIIKDNQNYQRFGKEEIVTSILNLGELYYALLKDFDEKMANGWKEKLKGCYLSITESVVVKAMKFKFENKNKNFSFVDCVGYILAKENNLKFLTGDKEFEDMKNVEFVK